MKVMNKYELANQPYGTAFYNMDKYGNIDTGLRILVSDTFLSLDNEPMFNGVLDLEPDTGIEDDCKIGDEKELSDLNWWDDSSADYDDDAMFLVLTKREALEIIKLANDLIEGRKRL